MKTIRRLFPRWSAMPPALRIYGLAVHEHMRPGVVERPGGGKRYLWMFLHSDAVIESGGTRRIYPANTQIIWAPGIPQVYGHPSQAWDHSWIVLDGARVSYELRAQSIHTGIVRAGTDPSVFVHNLLCMHRELTGRNPPDAVIIKNILQNWMRETRREAADAPGPHRIPRQYAALKRELEQHYDRRTSLAELAAKMHVSRWHLCREFKRCFGVSPIDLLLRTRMNHAAHFLRDPNLNVSEVARLSGYDDVFHFSKLFKKHYGLSPSQMRGML